MRGEVVAVAVGNRGVGWRDVKGRTNAGGAGWCPQGRDCSKRVAVAEGER